jgi:hypothetical protein
MENGVHLFTRTTIFGWIIFILEFLAELSAAFTLFFTLCITLVIGVKMVRQFQIFCEEFAGEHLQSRISSKPLGKLAAEFREIQIHFQHFNSIAGGYVLALVVYYCNVIVNNIFDVFQPLETSMNGRLTDILGILEASLIIISLSNLGTFMQLQVKMLYTT